MNSLSLRVASVKTGENVRKNSEIRATLLQLPNLYDSCEEDYCAEFRKATTIPAQVAAVKNNFKNVNGNIQSLQFLADLYFHSPLKHPVRNQILKLLITAAHPGLDTVTGATIDESSIVAALAISIQRLIEQTKCEAESGKWNTTITSLSGCFENFTCGLKAFEASVAIVFPFLVASLHKYLTELGVLSSPSVRNEYYLYVHNTIRVTLSSVQEFAPQLKIINSGPQQLQQLKTICRKILLDDDIPMDPRTNSGILMAQMAKMHCDFAAYMQEVKMVKNPNEISLLVGIVNAIQQDDFRLYSGDVRDVCGSIDEIANANATVPNILLCAVRALYHVSKLLLAFHWDSPTAEDNAQMILENLLMFAFAFMEHHMDSVRHLCRDLLRNIVALAKKFQFEFLLRKIYDACNAERSSLSMKSVVLQQVAVVLGADHVIKNCPGLFGELFAEHLGRDFIVNNLYEGLMNASLKERNRDDWLKLWIVYLLELAAINDSRLPDVEVLVVKAVKMQPQIVPYIIQQADIQIPISTKLSALWAVRKSGVSIDNFDAIMQNFSKHLLRCILSNCDETRIMALRLLVETHKTTELLTKLECEHLLTYLEYNANTQSPATRQKSLALLSKALIRCESNLLKILKQEAMRRSHSGLDKTPPTEDLMHLKFLKDFMRISVANLFHGANFSRRSVSLQLLEQCVKICINLNLNLEEVLPKGTIPALANSLGDTYEVNKELAVRVLKLIEEKLACSLVGRHQLDIGPKQMKVLLVSVRPMDSVTAAYQLQYFCNSAESSAFGHFELPSTSCTHYAALRWLVLELKAGLSLAKRSILLAAKLNPLYGLLFAVKHLLQHLDFQQMSKESAWRNLIAEMIVLCEELTSVVGPIVNSSSPEGHLPNDFSDLPAELRSTNESNATGVEDSTNCKILSSKNINLDMTTVKTTPQMVLLCAWRTVKEVSLILGEIVLRSPLQYDKRTEHFLVTKEQILDVGAHFKQLMAETKHRGAFEQAYVGFSKLCSRLWRVEASDLNVLPMQWLRDLVTLISKDEHINEKICATRRSAGVPFMVQALITSELQVGSVKALHYCMQQLFELCSPNVDRSSEARTHALNILRALFRCTDLNDAVGEYVSDGVICSIRGYDADTWSEKNSATLLFAALITRIFGVQRTKDSDNLNIRNKMTGRIFFLRYPKLYDFFLEQLQAASKLVLQRQKANKLHPLLLILSRLYPSALEGTESNLKLSLFIPFISECAGCPDMQTRFLAAKAIGALISKDAVPVAILKKCAEIVILSDRPEVFNLNTLHGKLLQILLLVRTHKALDSMLSADVMCTLFTLHRVAVNQNAVITKVTLDIFIEILSRASSLPYPVAIADQLLAFSDQIKLHSPAFSYFYAVLRKSHYIYTLYSLRLTASAEAIVDHMLKSLTLPYEQIESSLNVILMVLIRSGGDGSLKQIEEIEEFEISQAEKVFVNVLSESELSIFGLQLRKSKDLQAKLMTDVIKRPEYYPECSMKAYAILSRLDHFDFTLTGDLIDVSKRHPGDVKSSMAMCVERLIHQQGVDYQTSEVCLEYLVEIVQPWHPDCLRLKASRILDHIAGHYTKALETRRLTFVRPYANLMFTLLMDDDYDIRDYTAKIVLRNLQDNTEMDSVVSTMALRLFLQSTADVLRAVDADNDYLIEIFKIIAESLLSASGCHSEAKSDANGNNAGGGSDVSMPTELEVFDRNEANVFAEPLKTISDCIVVYRNTFKDRAEVLSFIDKYATP